MRLSEHIKNKLVNTGVKVDFYTSTILRREIFLHNLLNFSLNSSADYYYNEIISKTINNAYDVILVKPPESFPKYFYEQLKKNHPHSLFISYNQSPITWNSFLGITEFFDIMYSFDRNDAKRCKKIKYLPLYYIDLFATSCNNKKIIDLAFIGAYRPNDRSPELQKFLEHINTQAFTLYLYEYISKKQYLKYLASGRLKKRVHVRPLSHAKIAKIYNESNCVIDIHPSIQTGLTMRTFEVLASGAKLITTNREILKEKLYDENFIFLLNNNYSEAIEFINKPLPEYKIKNIEEYSLNSWLQRLIFNNLSK